MIRGMLEASVAAGQAGPVIMLSGEADITCTDQLSAIISAHLPVEPKELTIDMSGLRYADSASIQTLVRAAMTLKERGASLVLLSPQAAVARMLTLMGVDQILTVQGLDGNSRS